MTRFLLIRHALTDTAGNRLTGRMADIHLNERGTDEAKSLAQRLTALPVAAIYSSPLARAIETAFPIAASFNMQIIVDEDFNEMDFGEWTNHSISEMEHQKQFQLFNSFRSNTRIPGGELMVEAQLRMIKGIGKLRLQHSGQTVAIVSHADLIKATVAFYAGIPLDLFHRIEISPASVTIIEIFDDTARIVLVNDTGAIKF